MRHIIIVTVAQTDIDATNKWSWGENIGWMNWADANGGVDGVQVESSYLSGLIWCENAGWMSVGDGTPGGGTEYTNATGDDHGVNIDASDDLYGFAWSENIGWTNFDTRLALGALGMQARIEDGRFRGYVWNENEGWINLDDDVHFVGLVCEADCNEDGTLNILDFVCFQTLFQAGDPDADCNDDGALNILDFVCFQAVFQAGCP